MYRDIFSSVGSFQRDREIQKDSADIKNINSWICKESFLQLGEFIKSHRVADKQTDVLERLLSSSVYSFISSILKSLSSAGSSYYVTLNLSSIFPIS